MKILFVSAHDDAQQNWVSPLRAQGWGVVLARSVPDAERMMILHGEGLDAVVVHESFTGFAEKASVPFVVLTEKWGDKEIIAHQNTTRPAKGYLPLKSNISQLSGLWKPERQTAISLQGTGTTGVPFQETGRTQIRLVEATSMLARPEITKTSASLSLILKSPKVTLGGKSTQTSLKVVPNPDPDRAVEEVSIPEMGAPEVAPIEFNEATQMIERTSVGAEVNIPDFSLELSNPQDSGELIFEDLPEVSETDSNSAEILENRFEPRPAMKLISEASPDVEALRSYLAMREQDVAVLGGQLRSSKDRVTQLESILKVEKARNAELQELLSKADQTLKGYDQEKRIEMEVVEKQVDDLVEQLRERTEKARVIETRLRLMNEEVNKVKDRVRVDIRRIRVREKELEGQLEILKKDSGALMQARDEKILELKRRVDLLEFNMELAQEQYEKERRHTDELRTRLKDAAQAMKQANGLLEQ